MTNRTCKRLIGLLLAVLLTALTISTVFADTTIGTDASRPEYFEALGGSGSYNPLKTPYHYDRTTGNVAYCLEHKKDSPSSSTAYTDFDPSALWGHNTVTGIQAIVDHGYPNSTGGLSEEQAHYATANAIRAWMKESADVGYNFMRVDEGHIRPLSGTAAQQTWDFFLELLGYARAGATLSGTSGGMVRVYPANPVWEVQGDQLVARIEVSSSHGYTIRRSSAEVDISGYTGGTEDTLTLTAPLSLLTQDVQLLFTANAGSGAGVTLYWYEPVSASSQSVAVAQLGGGSGGTGEQQLVTIAGQKLVDLTVIKQDSSTGEALDGAVFALTDASGSPVGLTQTGAGRYTAGGNEPQFTTSGGSAMITGLTAGTYTLTEVSTPGAGYAGMEPETLQLTASATVTVTNVPTEITIAKVDGLTGEALAGMEFTLIDGDGNPVKLTQSADGVYRPDPQGGTSFVTDDSGQVRILGVPQGVYSIRESTHPGYAALSASPQFTLTSAADITITNEPLTLELTKVDGYTGDPLPGVRFSLRDADGNVVPIQSVAEGLYDFNASAQGNTLVTGANGKATVHYLPTGVYTLEEEPQAEYAQAAPVQVTVSTDSGLSSPAQVRFVNDPTLLLLTKSDAATREPLDGATFRLLDENGNVVRLDVTSSGNYKPGESGQETFTTQKGEAYIRYLAPGKYTVEEVSAPEGYSLDTPKTVSITDTNTAASPIRVTMQDAPLTLEFRKLDAETDAPLDGCTFGLKDADGKSVPLRKVSDGVYTSDEKGGATFTTSDGKATIARIAPGTYTLCEIAPADGYAQAQDEPVTVTQTSTSDKPVTVTMKNHKLALRITKVDAQTRQTLPGAAFRLTDAHGKTVKIVPIPGKPDTCEVAENGSDTFTIPQSGSLTILKLPVGEFTLTEARAPVGYAKEECPQKVLITNEHTADAPAQVVVENRALAVQVAKTDGLTGARLPGVRFRIERPTGAALRFQAAGEGTYRVDTVGVMDFATGADGVATLLGIPEGAYRLVEENNPGFGRVEPIEFTVTGESTQETPTVIGVENQPLALEIAKVDAQSLEPLSGVPFKLTDNKGNLLKFTQQPDGAYHPDENGAEQLLTDSGGKITLRYVPSGTLILSEGEYLGYSIGEPVEIEIGNENTVANPCKVTVENQPIALEITKTDLLTRKPMAGVEFEILDQEGKTLAFTRQENGVYYPAKEGETGVTQLTSDQDGAMRIEYLPQGDYMLREQPVTGYAPLGPIAFTLTSAHTQREPLRLNVQNLPTRLRIEKQDAVTQEPLPGAVFALTSPDGKPVSLVKQGDGTYHPAIEKDKGITEIPVDEKGCITVQYLPAGKYTVTEVLSPEGYGIAAPIETEVGTETIRHTVEGAQATDAGGKLLGETSLAVPDHPLALRIRKIHAVTKDPLPGAEFQLKADGNLTKALSFTEKGGVFWYDPNGAVSTLTLNADCEALLYGLPAGKYHLEETKVPDGYFPIAPVACTLTLENTAQAPLDVTISNAPAVKLGLDTDRYNAVIAVGAAAALLTILVIAWLHQKRRSRD